jgi:hypothetical protein
MALIPLLDKFDHGGLWHPSTDHLCFYCLIPKNASSWTSQVLKHNNWIQGSLDACPNQNIKELIVVLRDPVQRWVAGIAQYLHSYILHSHWYDRDQHRQGYQGNYIFGKENYIGPFISGSEFVENYNEIIERMLFDQISFDDHTQPQSWFINFYRPESCTWFYLDNNFQEKFLTHYKEYNFSLPDMPDYNRGNDNSDVKIITQFLTERINKFPYLKNKLLNHYHSDYQLIQQANFV